MDYGASVTVAVAQLVAGGKKPPRYLLANRGLALCRNYFHFFGHFAFPPSLKISDGEIERNDDTGGNNNPNDIGSTSVSIKNCTWIPW